MPTLAPAMQVPIHVILVSPADCTGPLGLPPAELTEKGTDQVSEVTPTLKRAVGDVRIVIAAANSANCKSTAGTLAMFLRSDDPIGTYDWLREGIAPDILVGRMAELLKSIKKEPRVLVLVVPMALMPLIAVTYFVVQGSRVKEELISAIRAADSGPGLASYLLSSDGETSEVSLMV